MQGGWDKMMKIAKRGLAVLKDAGNGWLEHKAPRMGAALSYYTVFSIGPLIVIAIAVAGAVFGQDAAQNRIFDQLKQLLGGSAATVVQDAVKGASKPGSSVVATVLGVVTLLIGATGAFGELHEGLNTIWGLQVKPNASVKAFVVERFLSFTMVLGTGFLLLVSLIMTTALAVTGKWLSGALPGGEVLWQGINFVISLAVISLVFTLLFKYLPDIRIRWLESVVAGAVTALFFSLGKFGLGLYIGKAQVASAYGAAGSLIVLLVWVYYSAQILYFGSEVSRALAKELGTKVVPARQAELAPVVPAAARS